MSSTAELELLAQVENWPADVKEKAIRAVRDRTSKKRKIWYCKRGRSCDGKAHDGVHYSHARGDQWPPSGNDWFQWLLMGGRGSGKTRSGSEYIRTMSRHVGRIALIAATATDARNTMIEGESGLVNIFESAGESLVYEPSKRRITFPSGCVGTIFSGEEPDRLRGPQHGLAWLDEPAHYPAIKEVYDQLLFGLRLGDYPRIVMTTTPLPTKWMKERLAEKNTRVSKVSTYANIDNLAKTFKETVLSKYEGTRLGQQELYGAILEDVEGALWQSDWIEHIPRPEHFTRIIVAIDPAGTANRRSDETGIVVVGLLDGIAYVLADYSGKYTPDGWAGKAIDALTIFDADAIVVEKNYGGDMVKNTIESLAKLRKEMIRVIVTTAQKSKALRAEPVVALYEQGRVKHAGLVASLEEEMLTWVPGEGDSPNRVDALVWGITELIKPGSVATYGTPLGQTVAQRPGMSPAGLLLPPGVQAAPGIATGLQLPPNFRFRRAA